MIAHLRQQRQTVLLGLAAAKRDGDMGRAALYQECLKDVNRKLREARRG